MSMTMKQLKRVMKTLWPIRQPAFVWGPPGIGKSQGVRQVADDLGISFQDLRLSTLDPVDLRGLPYLDKGRFVFAPLGALPADGQGILFLDELNSAPRAVQAAAYQLVLDRQVGEYRLPEGWWVVAAGNGEGDRAVTNQMPTPLMNRMIHLSLEPDLDSWTKWALAEGLDHRVIAFLRLKGQPDALPDRRHGLFFHFDPTVTRNGASKGFPTPRSWAFVARMLPVLSREDRLEVFRGTVGEEAAVELLAFLEFCDVIPDPAAILLNPDTAPVPKDPAPQYAVASALASIMSQNNAGQAMTYLDRCHPETQTMTLMLAKARDPLVGQTQAFIKWASANSHLLV